MIGTRTSEMFSGAKGRVVVDETSVTSMEVRASGLAVVGNNSRQSSAAVEGLETGAWKVWAHTG